LTRKFTWHNEGEALLDNSGLVYAQGPLRWRKGIGKGSGYVESSLSESQSLVGIKSMSGLIVNYHDGTILLRMNWPEQRNALDGSRMHEMLSALVDATVSEQCRCVVIAGTEESFCSGGDLRYFTGLVRDNPSAIDGVIGSLYQPLIQAIVESSKVVIAAVDAPAIGLGFDLALACDICFVGPTGALYQGWARVGLIPGAGGLYFLRQRMPKSSIWQFVIDQHPISAARAAELGLAVDAKRESGESAAMRLASEISRLPAAVIAGYKTLLRYSDESLQTHLESAKALQVELLKSREFRDRAGRILGDRGDSNKG
jgi:enoyl-CoA hydratase/carnithine racemase